MEIMSEDVQSIELNCMSTKHP